PPEIKVKPRNLQVRAGGIAAFYCAAQGDPTPVIQWKKNGKKVSNVSLLTLHKKKFHLLRLRMSRRKRMNEKPLLLKNQKVDFEPLNLQQFAGTRDPKTGTPASRLT
ncbi:Tyrosine-protein phosphatase Lar, partial [Gonioctena quinquepunctata]